MFIYIQFTTVTMAATARNKPSQPVLTSSLFLFFSATSFFLDVSQAASLQQLNVTLADNPTSVGFYIYVPDPGQLAAHPPILVNPHWCHGDAPSAYAGSTFAPDLADEYGFIVIYPDSPNAADKCWDVSSPQTLEHFGSGETGSSGGDSRGIVSMVDWTLGTYPQADASRVFVTGVSSGAMMTNVLVGAYPDVFAGGSAFAGVAYGCFAYGLMPSTTNGTGDGEDVVDYWNRDCADGLVRYTPAEWTAIVQRGYPGYGAGSWRPKMQVFHGTADETLNDTNLGEEIKEWTGVFGLLSGRNESDSLAVPAPTRVELDTPLANWTKMIYGEGDWFEAYSAWNVTHNIPVQEDVVMDFFDLTCVSEEGGGGDCFHWGEGGPRR